MRNPLLSVVRNIYSPIIIVAMEGKPLITTFPETADFKELSHHTELATLIHYRQVLKISTTQQNSLKIVLILYLGCHFSFCRMNGHAYKYQIRIVEMYSKKNKSENVFFAS
jgi:hypothetical protein